MSDPSPTLVESLAAADAALGRGEAFDAARDSAELPEADRDRYVRSAAALAALHRLRPLRPDPGPRLPPKVGRFAVERRLGGGGSGDVYLARDPDLGRLVAVKLLRSSAPADAARFQTEVTALAAARHPNIVAVYEQGTHDGRPFLVTEYLDGGTLRDRVVGKPQPDRYAAETAAALARAVHHAHLAGVVHRDVKPANVLLAADGTPKLSDFGLARWVAAEGPTVTGTAVGTPGFMSPEQAGGRSHTAGPAADVYGLGATLYKLLTGRPPFEGVFPYDVFRQVLADDPVSVRRLNPSAARDLETICLKCLEKNPARRYPTAAALADDLDRFLAGEPVRARPVGAAVRAARWCRRNALVAGLLAAVFASLASGLAGAGALYARAEGGRVRAEAAEAAADKERDDAVAARARAERAREGAERAAAAARAAEAALAAKTAGYRAVNAFVLQDLLRTHKLVGEGGAGGGTTLKELLDAAGGRLGARFRDDPRAELAVRLTLAGSYQAIGDEEAAVPHARRAADLAAVHLAPAEPDATAARLGAAGVFLHAGRDADALALFVRQAEVQTAALGRDHPEAIRARAQAVWAGTGVGMGYRVRELHAEALADARRVLGDRDPTTTRLVAHGRVIDRDLARAAAVGAAGIPFARLSGTRLAPPPPPVPAAAP